MRVFHRLPTPDPLPMQVCATLPYKEVYYSLHSSYVVFRLKISSPLQRDSAHNLVFLLCLFFDASHLLPLCERFKQLECGLAQGGMERSGCDFRQWLQSETALVHRRVR